MTLSNDLLSGRDTPKFCFICGRKLVSMYPGNDPEAGPRRMQCPTDEHMTLEEVVMMTTQGREFNKRLRDIINDMTDDTLWVLSNARQAALLHEGERLREKMSQLLAPLRAWEQRADKAVESIGG